MESAKIRRRQDPRQSAPRVQPSPIAHHRRLRLCGASAPTDLALGHRRGAGLRCPWIEPPGQYYGPEPAGRPGSSGVTSAEDASGQEEGRMNDDTMKGPDPPARADRRSHAAACSRRARPRPGRRRWPAPPRSRPPPATRSAYAAGSDAPIRVGFQVHRTGHRRHLRSLVRTHRERGGGLHERERRDRWGVRWSWCRRTTAPIRSAGRKVVEKFANQHQVDFVYGPLFSHVVIGSAPRAGELKIPLLRGQRGLPRRLRRAQPLRVPAGDHRRARAGAGDGAVGDGQPRQARHHDLPRTMRSGTTTATTSAPRSRRVGGSIAAEDRDPAHRVLVHQVLPAGPGRYRGCSTT